MSKKLSSCFHLQIFWAEEHRKKEQFRFKCRWQTRHKNRLSRESVDALSLELFKVRLDGALSNMV